MKGLLLLTVLAALMHGRTYAQFTPADDTLGPRPVWQHPLSATVTGGLLVAGTSTLFLEPSLVANQLVREEVQLWRRNHFGFASFEVENVLQYLALASVEGLDLLVSLRAIRDCRCSAVRVAPSSSSPSRRSR